MKTQKTKKSFKKKALLSSLSMLMVATVAVGSATFAWFTSNPYANAKGLQMKATASKGLVIHTESNTTDMETASAWRHTDYLNCNDDKTASKTDSIALNPVSFDLTGDALGAAYKVQAAGSGNHVAGLNEKVSDASGAYNGTGDYYQEKIYCKVNGGGDKATLKLTDIVIKDQKATIDMTKALRIAVQYYDASATSDKLTTKGIFGLVATENGYFVAPDGYTSGITAYTEFCDSKTVDGKTVYTLKNKKTFTTPIALDLGEVDTTGDDYVVLTIYLDGEDSRCFSDAISASDMIDSVDVKLKVEDAAVSP